MLKNNSNLKKNSKISKIVTGALAGSLVFGLSNGYLNSICNKPDQSFTYAAAAPIGALRGECGATANDHVHWKLENNGDGHFSLWLIGNGNVRDFAPDETPWAPFVEDITRVAVFGNINFDNLHLINVQIADLNIPMDGRCGATAQDHVFWALRFIGNYELELNIVGNGNMRNFAHGGAPWDQVSEYIVGLNAAGDIPNFANNVVGLHSLTNVRLALAHH